MEEKKNLFKEKSDLIKEFNFWFQNPKLSEEARIKALDDLRKAIERMK